MVSWEAVDEPFGHRWKGMTDDEMLNFDAEIAFTRGEFRFTIRRSREGSAPRSIGGDCKSFPSVRLALAHATRILNRIATTGK